MNCLREVIHRGYTQKTSPGTQFPLENSCRGHSLFELNDETRKPGKLLVNARKGEESIRRNGSFQAYVTLLFCGGVQDGRTPVYWSLRESVNSLEDVSSH